ncbi:MAG: hypothetical protein CVV06_14100 [Gammaproteobacteria bacterium HGW-Gammaproteobacteria-10]|nr:MAG: hypothetical protein CVV06_14100 [Gammaproteobacteria bacterium HGW-Gammaproteobacteria-10]
MLFIWIQKSLKILILFYLHISQQIFPLISKLLLGNAGLEALLHEYGKQSLQNCFPSGAWETAITTII